ncbi:MAG: RNA polymerase sigma factor [Aquihabitans sp.]
MTLPDFDEVLLKVRRGDERSYVTLWRFFNPPVLRYLRVLGASNEVEDVAADTWLDVVKGLDRFKGGETDFRAWIFTIARHRLFDLRRNHSRRPQTVTGDSGHERPDPGAGTSDLVESAAATEVALALIATLPPDQAEIVMLRVVAGLDVAAVAAIVGKKPGTVRVLAHRALKRLAIDLQANPSRPAIYRNDRGPGGA